MSWFQNFENDTWDWRVRQLADPSKASKEIVTILLDDPSLKWMDEENGVQWRWPREIYSYLVNYCQQSGAKSLAFDVLFNEADPTADSDEIFGQSLKDFKRFVIASRLSSQSGSDQFPLKNSRQLYSFSEETELPNDFPKISIPVKELADNSALIAHVNGSPDADGIYRSSKPVLKFDGRYLPSLGFGAWLAANPKQKLLVKKNSLQVGDVNIPLDKQRQALLRFRGPSQTHKTFSAAAILQSAVQVMEGQKPVVDPSELRNKYVIFGFSAPGLHDQHNTPMGGKYPGVEVHVTFLDNLLTDDFFHWAPESLNVLFAFLLALLCSLLTFKFNNIKMQIPIILFFFILPAAIAYLAASAGSRIALAQPFSAIAITSFMSMSWHWFTEGRQRQFIKHAFNHYLSHHFIDQIIKNPELLKLGGQRREISIFFSDLQGFTTISEKLEPEVLIEVLNIYLSAMSDIILEEKGTIDKYEGDAIIAFWNAPLEVENHAYQVVKSALGMQKALEEMQNILMEKTGEPLKMRIGIHTGPAVVGNMGASERFDYTMLGDSVNLAARLEGVNKQFGTFTIISQATKDQINDAFATRELARVAVVGRKEPVVIYEPMFKENYDSKKELLRTFDKGLQLFYKEKLADALKIFESISEQDAPSLHYADKCRYLIDSGTKAPSGVWQMTSK